MSFVTFPGTAGNYAETPDVNLLDADTAHIFQSRGFWATSPVYERTAVPEAFSGFGVKLTNSTGTRVFTNGTGQSGVPVDDVSHVGVSYFTTVAHRSYLQCEWYDAAGVSLGSSSLIDDSGPADTLPADTVINKGGDASRPPLAVFARFSLFVTVGEGPPNADVTWFDTWFAGSDSGFVPSLRIVGDLDIRADVAPEDESVTQRLLSTRDGNDGYEISVDPPNRLFVRYGDGASSRAGSSDNGMFASGQRVSTRATFTQSTGQWAFYKNGAPWGTFNTSNTNPASHSGRNLFFGSTVFTGSLFTGDAYTAEVRDGIDGPIVAQFDAADVGGVL